MHLVFFPSRCQSSKRFRLIALEEQRRSELLKTDQLAKECETNPTLYDQIRLEALRDFAFQRTQDLEQHRIHGLPSLSQQIAGYKLFGAWRKRALMELQQLRETERVSRG